MSQENMVVSRKEQAGSEQMAVSGKSSAVSGVAGKYQPYPEYKESGVEWYGRIPLHWKPQRIKFLIKAVTSGTSVNAVDIPATDNQQGVLKTSCVYDGTFRAEENKTIVEEEVARASCPVINDSLIVSRMNTPDLVGAAGLARSDYPNLFLPDRLWQVTFSTANAAFVHYWTLTKAYRSQVHMACTGTSSSMQNLAQDQFGNFELLVPPYSEQRTIVAFLDNETARIDALIAKQQRLIELLKEKRQAVISHAVTKGLNPNAPMKDSGVEWLGQVPAHWGVSSLGYYATLNTGATPNRANPEYWNGTIPWIKTGEVKYETIYETEEHISELALGDSSVKISPPGTLLMAMYGQGVTRGRVALLGVSATYNQACVAISPNSHISNEYLRVYFIAAYTAIRDGGNETSQMNLNADIVKKFKIVVPPNKEQAQITIFLEKELARYDKLIGKSATAIKLIKERRTALISAAVTGKIDVRGWQPPAEENTAEQE